jgi:parallel beta-helix repeat protein
MTESFENASISAGAYIDPASTYALSSGTWTLFCVQRQGASVQDGTAAIVYKGATAAGGASAYIMSPLKSAGGAGRLAFYAAAASGASCGLRVDYRIGTTAAWTQIATFQLTASEPYSLRSYVIRQTAGVQFQIIRTAGGTLTRNNVDLFTVTDYAPGTAMANVYWPGVWDWDPSGAGNRLYTDNMPSGYSRRTWSPSVNDQFKITKGAWDNGNNWSANSGINAYNKVWNIPRNDQGSDVNARIEGSPNTYVTLISKTAPSATTEPFGFLTTSAWPISITAVTDVARTHSRPIRVDSPVTVGITLSAAKCAQETVYVRYTTDNWTNSNFVAATGSGTAYSATFCVTSPCTVAYYALTSSADTPSGNLSHANADLLTLSLRQNAAGFNDSFAAVYAPAISSGYGWATNDVLGGWGSIEVEGEVNIADTDGVRLNVQSPYTRVKIEYTYDGATWYTVSDYTDNWGVDTIAAINAGASMSVRKDTPIPNSAYDSYTYQYMIAEDYFPGSSANIRFRYTVMDNRGDTARTTSNAGVLDQTGPVFTGGNFRHRDWKNGAWVTEATSNDTKTVDVQITVADNALAGNQGMQGRPYPMWISDYQQAPMMMWVFNTNYYSGATVYGYISKPYGRSTQLDGTLQNGATVSNSPYVFMPWYWSERYLELNGTTQYMSVNDTDCLDGMDTFTLATWIMPDVTTAATRYTIMHKSGAYWLGLVGNKLVFENSAGTPLTSSDTIGTDTWTFVAVTGDGTNVTLYINGRPQPTTQAHTAISATANNLYFGAQSGSSNYFDGRIDHPIIYRAALSQRGVVTANNGRYLGDAHKNTAGNTIEYSTDGGSNWTYWPVQGFDFTNHGTTNAMTLTAYKVPLTWSTTQNKVRFHAWDLGGAPETSTTLNVPIVAPTGFGTCTRVSAASVWAGSSGQTIILDVGSATPYRSDTIQVVIPAAITFMGSSDYIMLSGTGFSGADSSISGSGTATDSWIITIKNAAMTAAETGRITISGIAYTGGASDLFANGSFSIPVRTAYSGGQPANIASLPSITVVIPDTAVVISEVAHSGPGGTDDDFVELHNTLNARLNLNTWQIKYSAPGTDPGADGSGGGGAVFTLTSADSIPKRGYYLVAHTSYAGSVTPNRTSGGLSLGNAGGHVFLRPNGTTLGDKLGYGTATFPEANTFTDIPAANSNGSMERKANAASTAESMEDGADKLMGNGYDSDDNSNDFVKRTNRDPQNSISPSEPAAEGNAIITPSAQVAKSGRGEWTIIYTAGVNAFTNGRVDIKIPTGWTTPQNSNAAAAGYITTSVENGTLHSTTISGETIQLNVSLDAGTGKATVRYGYMNNYSQTAGAAQVRGTTGTDTFWVALATTGTAVAPLAASPSLKVVDPGALTFVPTSDPQSFIGAIYPLSAVVTTGGNAVHGAAVNFSIAGDGSDSSLSAVSGQHCTSVAVTAIGGYTHGDGTLIVNFKVSGTAKENRVAVTAPGLAETYIDNTRLPNPVISEAGFQGAADEYVEIYNPTLYTINFTDSSYHFGDKDGVNAIASNAALAGKSIGPHRYFLIEKAEGVTPHTANYINAGLSLTDGGDNLIAYIDVPVANTVVDSKPLTWFFGGSVGGYNVALERLWANRTASQASNWAAGDSIFLMSAANGKGSPGLANSCALYNSTITASETITRKRNPESVAITVTMLLNTGDTQPDQPVRLASTKGTDTFSQPTVTNENGVAVGYLYSTVSGTSTISVTYLRGITATVSVLFDYDSPNVPVLVSPAPGYDTSTRRPPFTWSAANDTQTGIWGYHIQVDNNTNFGSPEAESAAVSGLAFTPSSNLGLDTYYWRVRARDGAGNWSAWTESRVFVISPTTDTPIITSPVHPHFANSFQPIIAWQFKDPQPTDTQTAYEVQIDTGIDPTFASPAYSSGKAMGDTAWHISGVLAGARWYSVRVRTWDQGDDTSAWSETQVFYVLKRVADGTGSDWLSSLPSDSDAAIVSNGEFVWRDRQGDQRLDGDGSSDNYDLRAFRAVADTYYLYLRFDVTNMTENFRPLFSIAIDTDQRADDDKMNWIGDQSSAESSIILSYGPAQYSERNIDMAFEGAGESSAFVFGDASPAWWRPGYRPLYDYYSVSNNIVEYAIPREDAGFALDATIRVTLIVAQNRDGANADDPELVDYSGNVNTDPTNDALDAIYPGSGAGTWSDVISDSTIDFFVDITFDANGDVVANNAPSAAGITAVTPADGGEAGTPQPLFSWTEGTDADGDTLTYWIQVSTDNTFASVTQQATLVRTTSWTPPATLTNDTYYWRIRARDNRGTLSTTWSSTFSFQLRTRGQIDGNDNDWFGTPSSIGHDTTISEGEFIYTGVVDDRRTDGGMSDDMDITEVRFTGDTTSMFMLVRLKNVGAKDGTTDPVHIAFNVDVDQNPADVAMTWLADDAEGNVIASAAAYGETNIALHNTTTGVTKVEMYEQSGWGGVGWHAPVYGSADWVFISMDNNLLEAAFDWRDFRPLTLPGKLRFTLASFNNNVIWNNAGDATGNYVPSAAVDVMTPHTDTSNAWDRDASDGDFDYYVTVPFNQTGRVNHKPSAPTLAAPAAETHLLSTSVDLSWTLNDVDGADAKESAVRLQIATDAAFTSLIADSTFAGLTTSRTVTLASGRAYYWRIQDRDDFDSSAWSDSRCFIVRPRPWYINNGATGGGDSWTTAVGNDGNHGFLPSKPKLTLGAVIPHLMAGETIYIDAGTFTPGATLTIETGPIRIYGVDSALTIIDFADSSVGASRALYCTTANVLSIQDLEIRDAYYGLILRTVDSSVIRNVRVRRAGAHGFLVETSADSNHFFNCHALQSTTYGFYLGDANRSLLSGNRAETNGSHGFMLAATSETNTLTGNLSTGNGGDGFHLTGGSDSNLLTGNTGSFNTTANFTTTGSTRNSFVGNTASGGSAQGFYIASDSHLIRNNIVTAAGGDGIALVFSGYSTIDSNTIASPGGKGIAFEGSSWNISRNNLITSSTGRGVSIEKNSDENIFTSDTIRQSGGVGFFIGSDGGDPSERNTVTNVRVDTAGGGSDGFKVEGGESNTFTGCLASGGSASGFAIVGASDSTSIHSCSAIGVTGIGYYIASHRNSIRNSLSYNVGSIGFAFVGADTNQVISNTADSSFYDGFKFEVGACGNTVRGNISRANLVAGYLFCGPSSYNVIEENLAERNGANGFFLQEVGTRPVGNAVRFNRAYNNSDAGFRLFANNDALLAMNRSDSNAGWAFHIDPWSDNPVVIKNNIVPPAGDTKGLYSDNPHGTQNLIMTRNWWGTRDTDVIYGMIGGTGRDTYTFTPFRLGIVDTTAGADTVAPAAPDTATAEALDDTSIMISWSESTTNEEPSALAANVNGYRIYRAMSADTSIWTLWRDYGTAVRSFVDSGLSQSETYYYRVTAYDNMGNAIFVNESFYSDSTAAAMVISGSAEVTLTKSLYAVTLGGVASPPIPGASVWYELTYSNLGPANADTTIIRDSIALTATLGNASRMSDTLGASATFHDTLPASGWQFQYSTSASPDQSDTSADYVAGWPAAGDLASVRWIRWRRSAVPNGQSATIRFRMILK